MTTTSELFNVDVICARTDLQKVVTVQVAEGTTCLDAVKLSNILDFFPDIDIDSAKLGIYSRVVKPSEVLQRGDRVEIYRPLIADPKDVRRRRAEQAAKNKS